MQRVIFDFDPVSPYAYLAFERLPQALEGVSYHVDYRPVLLGALFKAWGHVAPADVVPKKEWLFRQCEWIAARDAVAFVPPRPHPFSSLPLLRMLIASVPAGQHPNRRSVESALRHVWARDGGDPNDPLALQALSDAIAPLRDPSGEEVKAELRTRTANAVDAGVFGVPTFRLDDGRLFWGLDSLEMLAQALKTG